MKTETKTGIVKSFNNAEGKGGGYGFIARDDGADLFVHIRAIVGAKENGRATLFPGDQVSFEIGDHKGRDCAVNVRVQVRAANSEPQHIRD